MQIFILHVLDVGVWIGFFIGLLDHEPISCFSAVAYDYDFGFLGFFVFAMIFRKETIIIYL